MSLSVKPINRKLKEFKQVNSLMKSSFPCDELISLSLWRLLALRNKVYFLAFYDSDEFIGVIYIVESDKYVYVPFLAVDESLRDKGYGSQILNWTKDSLNKTLVLHIEPIDEKSSNNAQRIRRVNFYHKNNIEDTGYRFKFFGVPLAVYSSDVSNFDISIHNDLMNWFAFNVIKFKFKKV